MQPKTHLGDDEVLGRVRGSLETARLAAMALGAITVTALVELPVVPRRWRTA